MNFTTLVETLSRRFSQDNLPLEGKKVRINVDKVISRKEANNPMFVEYVKRNKDVDFIAIEGIKTFQKGLYSLQRLDEENIVEREEEELSDGYWLFTEDLLIEI